MVSISLASALAGTSSLISYAAGWLRAIKIWAKGLSKNSFLRDNNKFQASRADSWKHIVNSSLTSFTVRITEFRKSQENSDVFR